jgi:hypothetical protein
VHGTEDEYAAIDLGWADRDAIDESGLPYKGRVGSQHTFSVELTHVSFLGGIISFPCQSTDSYLGRRRGSIGDIISRP